MYLDMRKKFAENLLKLLNESHMNQMDLAKRMGVSTPTVSDWVRAVKYPRIDKMQKLADIFHVPMGELMGTEPDTAQEAAKEQIVSDLDARFADLP